MAALALGTILAGCGTGTGGPPADIVIRHVDVLPMDGRGLLRDRDVTLRAGRVEEVGPGGSARVEGVPTVVPGRGRTLLPGLVDMHAHVRSARALPLYLARGVTTVRTMNGAFGDPLTWRAELRAGTRVGPDLVVATPTIRLDRDSTYEWAVRDGADARRLVRRAAEAGYDLVKVYQVPDSVLLPLAREAADVGLPVAGHVPYYAAEGAPPEAFREELRSVLSSGMLGIEHLGGLHHAWFQADTSEAARTELAHAVRDAGVVVTPILAQDVALGRIVLFGKDAFADTALERVRRFTGEGGLDQFARQVEGLHGSEPWPIDGQRALLRTLHDEAVPLLLGTDSHSNLALAGFSLVEEIGAWAEAGVPVRAALEAGTAEAARVLGRLDGSGTVGPGKAADLLLVEGDPLEDWRALHRVAGVVRDGSWFSPARLDALVEEALEGPTFCLAASCPGEEGDG